MISLRSLLFIILAVCFSISWAGMSTAALSYNYDVAENSVIAQNNESGALNYQYDSALNLQYCCSGSLSSDSQEKNRVGSFFALVGDIVAAKGSGRVFHRLGDSKESIEAIAKSGELKGNPPRNFFASDIPKVQAYEGPLSPNAKGFEFTTPAKPDRGHVPGKPTWSGNGHNPDVRTVNDQAIISCTVTRVNC